MKQSHLSRVVLVVAGTCVWLSALAVAWAQTPPPPGQPPRRAGSPAQGGGSAAAGQYSVAELQQLFDALTLMQAEQALKLSEAQYPAFVSKLKTLQQQRRRYQQQHRQVIQQLVRLTGPAATTVDEAAIREQLKALTDLDQRAAADLRAAYDAIDQILTVPQQARFRILEEQLERRKVDLLARARRGAQAGEPKLPKPIK